MIGGAGFAYALARLHARLAERMDEPGWQQLETSLDLGHALELAGRSRLARFTRRLTRASDVHMIDPEFSMGLWGRPWSSSTISLKPLPLGS